MTVYKVLAENGAPYHGGKGVWPLPNGSAGEWIEVKGKLVPCENGLHLCRRDDLVEWLGPIIYDAEYDGEMIEHDDKIVVRRARLVSRIETWNDRTTRLFAADCAERVLHIYEREYLDDNRVRNAIEISRKVANGEADVSELAAARDAAWAARDAAWAARDAAWAAARDAVRDAAWAARDAAWAAAWDAEREWQTNRLFEYLNGDAATPTAGSGPTTKGSC